MSSHFPLFAIEPSWPTSASDAPILALFEDQAAAQAATARTGARMLRRAAHGVLTFAPAPGLREDLYAAGALLVVG